ncbi:MAG: hypothetical protein Fur0032_15490 [Terrimicrobiaceae bacterium]
MQITRRTIDDFKTERKEILPPLQTVFRLVPILFYCAIIMTVLLASIYLVQLSLARERLAQHTQELAETNAKIQATQAERASLEGRILRATDIRKWVEGSQPLQPLVVAIARSIQDGSSLVDLRIERDEATPSQLKMMLKIGTTSIAQLERTLDAINSQGFRVFSPQQSVSGGEIDYRSTLVRQTPGIDSSTSTEVSNP